MKQLVTEIFAQFVTPKERKQSRPNTISYGDEGSYEYDPEEEVIVSAREEKVNKVIVATYREDPMEEQFEYALMQKDGKWLIDTKKCYDDLKEKWVNESL